MAREWGSSRSHEQPSNHANSSVVEELHVQIAYPRIEFKTHVEVVRVRACRNQNTIYILSITLGLTTEYAIRFRSRQG